MSGARVYDATGLCRKTHRGHLQFLPSCLSISVMRSGAVQTEAVPEDLFVAGRVCSDAAICLFVYLSANMRSSSMARDWWSIQFAMPVRVGKWSSRPTNRMAATASDIGWRSVM